MDPVLVNTEFARLYLLARDDGLLCEEAFALMKRWGYAFSHRTLYRHVEQYKLHGHAYVRTEPYVCAYCRSIH